MRARRMLAMASLAVALIAAGCSSDSSDGADDSGSGDATAADAVPSGGATGTLTLDGEQIELTGGRCYLEEQPAAAGGGSIEATAQADGTDADGDAVLIDVTRFSADNQFAGDDVSITIGDPFDPASVTLSGSSDIGTVSIEDSTVSASQFEVSEDLADTVFIDFTIDC